MNLAIIPARIGSKRIPKKNVKDFCGKPIIAWSIEEAIKSSCFDRIIVSTDCEDLAEIAIFYGAEVPFIRPSELANDYADTTSVVKHGINFFINQKIIFDNVCCIYATAPFLQSSDLKKGLALLNNKEVSYSMPVTSYRFPIQRAIKINANNRVEMFNRKNFKKRSQDFTEAWHDAGQFYWGRADAWLNDKLIFDIETSPIILPSYRVQDIDTPEDWKRAEKLFKNMK
jgi:N-acylneuraminate cytidylyltransferase